MTTPIDIAELERLERAAPGRRWEKNVVLFTDARIWLPEEDVGIYVRAADSSLHGKIGEICDVIVSSRNAIPELIASLKIAVKELEQHAKDTETHDGCRASKKALAEIRKRVTVYE